MEYRRASEHDIEPIAAIHADSWRRNYRGAYSDAFLDGMSATIGAPSGPSA